MGYLKETSGNIWTINARNKNRETLSRDEFLTISLLRKAQQALRSTGLKGQKQHHDQR